MEGQRRPSGSGGSVRLHVDACVASFPGIQQSFCGSSRGTSISRGPAAVDVSVFFPRRYALLLLFLCFWFSQVKKASTVSFVPLKEALRPDRVEGLILPTDFGKLVSHVTEDASAQNV